MSYFEVKTYFEKLTLTSDHEDHEYSDDNAPDELFYQMDISLIDHEEFLGIHFIIDNGNRNICCFTTCIAYYPDGRVELPDYIDKQHPHFIFPDKSYIF